jgi:uncharacterized membrane protein YgdD (TMEM256/DUF423 family)
VLAREKVGKVLGPTTPLGGAVMMAGYVIFHSGFVADSTA